VVNSFTWYQPKNPNRFRSSSSTLAGRRLPPSSPWRLNLSPPTPMPTYGRRPLPSKTSGLSFWSSSTSSPTSSPIGAPSSPWPSPPTPSRITSPPTSPLWMPHGSGSMPWFFAGSTAPWLWTLSTSSCLPRLPPMPPSLPPTRCAGHRPLQRQQEDP
jgi:hypothetical protein